MEGLQLALFADNPHLVPEGLQGTNIHVPCLVGYVIQTSQEAQPQVSNAASVDMQQSNPQVTNGNVSDESFSVVQSHPQVTNGNASAERYFIVNDYSREYLGESMYSYYSEERSWLFTTNWAYQPDKSEKFQWFVTRSAGMGSDYKITNVLTGHAVQESGDVFNDVGDHVVTGTSDTAATSCKWFIDEDTDGSYSICNVSSGSVLGASKKEFNNRGDHHIMSSPHTKDYPSVKKWKWRFVLLQQEAQEA